MNTLKKGQQQLLHDQSLAKAEMIRKLRKRYKKKMMSENKSQESQFFNEMAFKSEIGFRQKK